MDTPDSSGVVPGNGVIDRLYHFSKRIYLDGGGGDDRKHLRLHPMSNWNSFTNTGHGGVKNITWHKFGIRPATDSEVAIESYSSVIANNTNNINTLYGKTGVRINANGHVTGWELNNNGSSGNFVVSADNFSIVKPGSNARLEYSNNQMRVYDANNVMRVRLGIW